jgi:hypothetical protein
MDRKAIVIGQLGKHRISLRRDNHELMTLSPKAAEGLRSPDFKAPYGGGKKG